MKPEDKFTAHVVDMAYDLASNIKKHAHSDFIKLYGDSDITDEKMEQMAANYVNCCMAQELALNLSKY